MRLCKLQLIFAFLVFSLVLCGCGGGGGGSSRGGGGDYTPSSPRIYTLAEAESRAQWTILVYLDADNDLEDAGIDNFNQMEMVGSTKDVHVVVQMDRWLGDNAHNEQWTDTRRYLVTHDTDTKAMHSIRLDNPALGELDMGNPATLRQFVQWGMRQFPAEHYMLVLWDHGSGWHFRNLLRAPQCKFVVSDDTDGGALNVTEIPVALAGLHQDIIAFDACNMQQIEVGYELRNSADYLVGSATVEPSAGYNYARILSNIGVGDSPAQICRTMVQQYSAEYPSPNTDITQSAIDLRRLPALASALDDFGAVLRSKSATNATALAAARDESLDYSWGGSSPYNIDVLDYASRGMGAVGSASFASYAQVQSAMSAVVVASIHNSDMPNAHGLSIYVPPPGEYEANYALLAFARDTAWEDWIQAQRE